MLLIWKILWPFQETSPDISGGTVTYHLPCPRCSSIELTKSWTYSTLVERVGSTDSLPFQPACPCPLATAHFARTKRTYDLCRMYIPPHFLVYYSQLLLLIALLIEILYHIVLAAETALQLVYSSRAIIATQATQLKSSIPRPIHLSLRVVVRTRTKRMLTLRCRT